MPWYEMKGAGLPAGLQAGMDSVLNKKFGTSTTYPPAGWPDNVNLLGPLPIKTASGSIASFSDGADDVSIAEGVFSITAQGGGGSPSQPIPIVGFTGMTVRQTGKNLLKLNDGTYALGNTGITATVSSGEIHITGTSTASGGRTTRLSDYFVLPKGTYIISPVISTSPYVRSYINKKSDNTAVGYSTGNSITITEEVEVYFGIGIENGKTYDVTLTPQIEVGSTIGTYEAYKSKTPIPVSWQSEAGTVYGGELSISNGTAKVIKFPIWTLNGSTGYWSMISVSQGTMFRCALQNDEKDFTVTPTNIMCNMYEPKNQNQRTDGSVSGTGSNFDFIDNRFSSLDDFKNAINQTPIFICAIEDVLIPAPTEIAIDPISISTYYGSNNIWCDTGESAIQYRADIQLALNE